MQEALDNGAQTGLKKLLHFVKLLYLANTSMYNNIITEKLCVGMFVTSLRVNGCTYFDEIGMTVADTLN